MTSPDPKKEIRSRIVRIKMNDGSRVNGQVNIKRDPGHDRLSDLLENNNEPFVVVFDATLDEVGVEKPVKYKTIFINKNQITFATPDEAQK